MHTRRLLVSALLILAAFLIAAVAADATDLIEVTIGSEHEADMLRESGTKVVLPIKNGYLVAGEAADLLLYDNARLVASDIDLRELARLVKPYRPEFESLPVVYRDRGVTVVRATAEDRKRLGAGHELVSLRASAGPIRYVASVPPPAVTYTPDDTTDSLMAEVLQDSTYAYLLRLEAFYRRVAGTDSNLAARNWIASKFADFGYDSVVFDSFQGATPLDLSPVPAYNVVATLPGTLYPDRQIVFGAHFDAVVGAPGADDNASGTSGLLEIARVLAGSSPALTIKFIAFDSEEAGILGAKHYADSVRAAGEDIALMINLDMIGNIDNDTAAYLKHSAVTDYPLLWSDIAANSCGLTAVLEESTNSDAAPFVLNGYDAIFIEEYEFSQHYHLVSDSSTYINFDYLTRMTKASLGLGYMLAAAPPPLKATSVLQTGDGQSLAVYWRSVDYPTIDHVRVTWYEVESPTVNHFIELPATAADSVVIGGLTEGDSYAIYIEAFDIDGQTAPVHPAVVGTPVSQPIMPTGLIALPYPDSVGLTWQSNNTELDFDHYEILRDGAVIATTTDTVYFDSDPSIGFDQHDYQVLAVDAGANESDSTGIAPTVGQAAALTPNRVLAVNRTSGTSLGLADETASGAFLRDALEGWDYVYLSDTAAGTAGGSQVTLNEMAQYGVVVVCDESALGRTIDAWPNGGGILDSLAHYVKIGGSLVVYGRFGTMPGGDTLHFVDGPANFRAYSDVFGVDWRVQTESHFVGAGEAIGDFVGALAQDEAYPMILWDSIATAAHTAPYTAPMGVPCMSFVDVTAPGVDVLYGYDAADDNPAHEGKTVGWRYLGADYQYVWFDIPFSFMQRTPAITALRQAVVDLTEDIDQDGLANGSDNCPGDYNPGQSDANGDGIGDACCCTLRGDADGSGACNVSDLTYLVAFLFQGGAGAACPAEMDNEASGDVTVSDLTYLVAYLFQGGPDPVPCR